jgi:hypothetical protein
VQILAVVLGLLAALLVPVIVLDVKARRRGRRLEITGDPNDVYGQYPTVPYNPPAGPVDAGGGVG